MVRYRRNFVAGGTVFFTVVLSDRSASLLTDHADALCWAFRDTRAAWPFDIDAIVVLPDHLHALMRLGPDDADWPGCWRSMKSGFTRALRRRGFVFESRDGGGFAVWQRRYWDHMIRDDADFARHMDYIHINPVKHGLVAAPRAWPYSSIHRYVREGIVPPDWGTDAAQDHGLFGEPPAGHPM